MDDENLLCTTKNYDFGEAKGSFFNYNPNAEVIVPGIALHGNSLGKGTPDKLLARRGGGAIAISVPIGATSPRIELEEVTVTKSLAAINHIIASTPNVVPGNLDIQVIQVEAKEQLNTHVGAKLSWLPFFDSGGSLDFSTDKEYNRVLVMLTHRFYTMVFDRPSSIDAFFHSDVTPGDLQNKMRPYDPPVYISSVTYGRLFFLLFESTSHKDTMKKTINATFAFMLEIGGDANETRIKKLDNLVTRTWSLGGKGDEVLRAALSDNLDDLKNYLAASVDIRTGEPLSYQVRSVRSDRIVKNGVATQYSVENCEFVSAPVPDPIVWFVAEKDKMVIDNRGDFGEIVLKWSDDATGNDAILEPGGAFNLPSYQENFLHGAGAVEFTSAKISGFGGFAVMDRLNFSGSGFRNTDYTVTAVLNWNPYARSSRMSTELSPDSVFCFINSLAGSDGIQLGFKGRGEVYMAHNGAEVSAQMPQNTLGVDRIYTFRFSQSEGISIFMDGELLAKNENQTVPLPLNKFRDAVLGLTSPLDSNSTFIPSVYGGRIYIAELIGFNEALDNEQRKAIEDKMRYKYRL